MNQEELNRAGITAWYAIALEHDKLLFKLSVAGIALVMYLISHDVLITSIEKRLYLAGLCCFFIAMLGMSIVFSQNRLMLERKLAGQDYDGNWLLFFDVLAVVCFFVGWANVVAVGLNSLL